MFLLNGNLFPYKKAVGARLTLLNCLTYGNMFPCSHQNISYMENGVFSHSINWSCVFWHISHVLEFTGYLGTFFHKALNLLVVTRFPAVKKTGTKFPVDGSVL